MKLILLLAAAIGALSPLPALAEQTPRSLGADARIREVNYTDGNVIQIRSAFRTATQIEFAPGEVIKFVAMGDTVSWEVAPADNSLFVKPRERAGATNLIVVTDFQGTKRNYTFELSAVAGARSAGTFFKVRLRYPEYEALQARLAQQRAQLTAALGAQNGAIKAALDIGVLEGKRNLNYKVQGSSALQPSEVSDNGQFTVLRFPNQREIPAIFTVNPDGSEATASFDVRDEFVVVHGIYKEMRLRRGKVVLCIYNESPNFYGRDPKTDTASEVVERTTEN
ncbi:TrbG/VirB9 family P-type conjugative transfer protein [Sphingomonas faeni]|uniref:TrbG/VirB9 family P-type conjugative transfer protein n=1 Tax=Sphingomonas faeni TaxID=185950 RepID=UPI0020C7D117|nr:TrbG/VirB9 family P-type conjugative transfer protein [Sphingomonas faeni]MCP8892279.1 TrbG/VirB9 family P-type conjugative transfer protein [Sphingomonas faeni]